MKKTKIILTADATPPVDYNVEFDKYVKEYFKLAEEKGVDLSKNTIGQLMNQFFCDKMTESIIKYGIGEEEYGIKTPKAKINN